MSTAARFGARAYSRAEVTIDLDTSLLLRSARWNHDTSTSSFADISYTGGAEVGGATASARSGGTDPGAQSVQFLACGCPCCAWMASQSGQAGPGTVTTPDDPAYNGGSATSTAMAATGDQRIDALLSGVKWNTNSLTYADTDAASDYQAGYNSDGNGNGISAQNEGFSRLSAQELLAVHFSLNDFTYTQPSGAAGFSVEGFTGLSLTYSAGDGAANIRVANSSDPRTSYASYPDAGIYAGDAFIGTSARSPTAGNYSWFTMMHELGHTMGLKHGHETQTYGALPAAYDSNEYSIMTYKSYIGSDISSVHWEQWGAPQTFMMLDIAALQAMYGADYTTNSGNTVYSWSPTTGQTFVDGVVAINPGGNRVFMTIWDGGGIDTYDLSNYSSNLEINLEPGGYTDFNAGQNSYLGGGPNGGYARGNVFNALLFQGNFGSIIENANGGSGNDLISGNSANNTLRGNGGADYLYGYAGTDYLYGGDGNDVLLVGSGNGDQAYGEGGDDIIYWGPPSPSGPRIMDGGVGGTDSIHGGGTNFGFVTFNLGAGTYNANNGYVETWSNFENYYNGLASGNETVIGTDGNNTLQTGSGSNNLDGGAGEDILLGGGGGDVLYGGYGKDTIYGQDGNDLIIVRDGEYVDDVDGGAGIDTLNVAGETFYAINVNLTTGVWTGSYNPTSVTITGVENVTGTQVGDTIVGDGNTNILHGGGGGDIINGGGGSGDEMYGDDGDDRIYWGPPIPVGPRIVDGGNGIDTIDGGGVNFGGVSFNLATGVYTAGSFTENWTNFENYFNNGVGSETVTGTTGNNVLTTGSGSNALYGADGDDRLDGGLGDDLLDGGAGIDIADYSTATAGVVISAQVAAAQSNAGAGNDTLVSIEGLIGSAFDDVLTGTGNFGAYVRAGDGNDIVYASIGPDDLDGGAGTDTLNTSLFSGDYVVNIATGTTNYNFETMLNFENIVAGAGNDTLTGTDGINVLNGGAGNDTLIGGLGNDRLFGGADFDIADYSGTAVRVRVDLAVGEVQNTLGAGVDRLTDIEGLRGSAFNDQLYGNAVANLIEGGAGNDLLRGEEGNDRLLGGDGIDRLLGGAGNDTLIGGLGRDTLYGGGGRDIFAFASADTPNTESDLVADFVKAIDRIDLSAISAEIGHTLSFLGSTTYTGAGGEFFYRISAGDTRVLFDLDGDKVTDLTIRFTSEILFAATDFILT